MSPIRRRIIGRGLPLPGKDIDTDRIMPARFLKSVTFEGLEEHLFKDDRLHFPDHPFNQERYKGAAIIVVGHNFGCGSSREHAPEALRRWGIRGIVGESFGDIFLGNCTAIGIPCLSVDAEDADWLMDAIAEDPQREIVLDVENREVLFGDRAMPAEIPSGHHEQLLAGTWNATFVLLEAGEEIERVAKSLPYVSGH